MTANNVRHVRRDLFKEKLDAGEVRSLFARAGLSPARMLSTRSRPYAELRLSERILSEDEIVDLKAEYPALIRRPIILTNRRTVVGFNRAAIEALISS